VVKDATAGDPVSGITWTRKTLRAISVELRAAGFKVGHVTVRRLLIDEGYRLRTNRKRLTKSSNPDRDEQMRYIAQTRRTHLQAKKPVISVDTKQRELVGNFKNDGRTWRKQAVDVLSTDYPNDAEGVAIPYGVYDVARNEGFMAVGTSHQTAQFAVAAIRVWWLTTGCQRYPGLAQRALLIEADSGGANAARSWLWKYELQTLADECRLTITVTHLPTGASKWNPIEHRLFCHVTRNWAGQPLINYDTVLNFIRTTKTLPGLQCQAWLDQTDYSTGLKITAEQRLHINLKPHRVLPKWNYTIRPRRLRPAKSSTCT